MVAHSMDHEQRSQRRKEIAKAVKDGTSVAEAAAKHGVSLSSVHMACREHRVKIPKLKKGSPPAFEKTVQIIARLLEGKSYEAIGEEFGVSKQRVGQVKTAAVKAGVFKAAEVGRKKLRDQELELRQLRRERGRVEHWRTASKRDADERHAKIVEEVRGGATAKATSEKWNIGVSRIYQILREHGVEAPEYKRVRTGRTKRQLRALGMLMDGASISEVAKKLKVGEEPVRRLLDEAKRAGIKGL